MFSQQVNLYWTRGIVEQQQLHRLATCGDANHGSKPEEYMPDRHGGKPQIIEVRESDSSSMPDLRSNTLGQPHR
jgi:hypothetical protein